MEYTWHFLSLYTLYVLPSLFCLFVCVYLFVFACAVHAHMFFVMSTCVWDKRRKDNMQQIKTHGGGGGGMDRENISNRSMLLLNCSPWEVIIPCSARGSAAVHMHFIQRLTLHSQSPHRFAGTSGGRKRDSLPFHPVHSENKNIRWFQSVASCIWASNPVMWGFSDTKTLWKTFI